MPGFVGAVFMASRDDRLLLDLVAWESESALAAAMGDDRYAGHREIMRLHSETLHLAASSDVVIGAPMSCERGDILLVSAKYEGERSIIAVARNSDDVPDADLCDQFDVIEVVSGDVSAAYRPTGYRLLPVGAGHDGHG